MTPLFKKLNWKGQQVIHLLQAPPGLEHEWEAMKPHTAFENKLPGAAKSAFLLAFCTQQKQVEEVAALAAAQLEADGLV